MIMSTSRPRLALFIGIFLTVIVIFFRKNSLTRTYRSYAYGTDSLEVELTGSSSSASASASAKPNAVIFMLVAASRLHQAILALRNVEDRFNRRLGYPYVLFTTSEELDSISEQDKDKIAWITQGRATFAALTKESWGVPDFYDKSRVEDSLRNVGFSLGYRSMCRFYSGFFWRHPALERYDWLWRLDTDVEFHCDIPYDPVERMISEKALYGFVQINVDATWVQPTLAPNVSHFLAENARLFSRPNEANHAFVWDAEKGGVGKALRGEAGNEEWTKMCMYNNFEISHKSIWESEIYTKFFEFLDRAGGFFYERWSDSPIHSFAVSMMLKKEQVLQFRDLGYQHQGWAYECPELDRCTCERDGVASGFDDNGHRWFNA